MNTLTINHKTLFAYLCLVGISLIWGTTFLVIRVGVQNFPPFLFAGIRQISAGILLTGFLVLVKGEKLPSIKVLLNLSWLGFLMIACGNGLVSWAEVFVPSGLAAIICSTMPIMVILINLSITKNESPNLKIIAGSLLGLGGIILVFSEYLMDFANANYRTGILFIFISTFTWAFGSILGKKINKEASPFLNAGLQMFFGGVLCIPLSLLFDDLHTLSLSVTTVYSLIYLIVFGSAIAFAMYSYALTHLPVTVASLYSYINPLVAVVLGWLILDEKLNFKIGLAFLITVSGIYLVNSGYKPKNK